MLIYVHASLFVSVCVIYVNTKIDFLITTARRNIRKSVLWESVAFNEDLYSTPSRLQ